MSTAIQQPYAGEVPVLCYHNFTLHQNTTITVSRSRFEEHLKMLRDSGYQTVLPDQLYEFFTEGRSLPAKPVMISFDDSRGAQYRIARPLLEQYGFKGVFFIMTVCLNKPDYLTTQELKALVAEGHAIGGHTFDHPSLRALPPGGWKVQLEKTKHDLETILNRPVRDFAYPYGAWSASAIVYLKAYGYRDAFQLDGRFAPSDTLYTIRRLLVGGNWNAATLYREMFRAFPSKRVALTSTASALK